MDEAKVTFLGGQVAPVMDVRDGGAFLTGIASRDDGLKRIVFLSRVGIPHTDPWLERPSTGAARRAG